MSTRLTVLVFLLVVLIIASQFEWKQQEAESNPDASHRRQQILLKEEAVKERIILSQEKTIQQLNELIQSLQLQLLHCRGNSSSVGTAGFPNEDDHGPRALNDHHP